MTKTEWQNYPLGAIEVLDGACENALKKETDYLLSLQEGRLLAGFYETAGIKTSFVRYGGWESGLIGGHTLGHYLTALAQAAVNAGVPEGTRTRLYQKLENAVDGLAVCQRHSRGERGFLFGAPLLEGGAEAQFDHVEQGKTDIKTEAWVPWYTMHKLLAGLVSAYLLTGSEKALFVASELGDWAYRRTARCTEETRKRVLGVEYGGMNDALYALYACTGSREHALAAHFFDEEPLFDLILSGKEDALDGLHANTTIPKVLGALNRYLTLHGEKFDGETVDASRYLEVAKKFFDMVVERHTYVTGGNSEWEHFGRDYVLDAERTNCNCETCNVYNMLKLARALFCATGDKRYTDYYDTAFTNQILASQNPETGMTTYFQPMASGYFKVFSTPENSFWCCTGSGMESFTKLGDSVYYKRGKAVFVEQYLSSRLRSGDLSLVQTAVFPFRTEARFTVEKAAEPFPLCFRIPDWAAGEVTAKKNGAAVKLLEGNGHASLYVREGDEVVLTIPVGVSLKGLPDGKNAFAFLYGGAVLAAEFGTDDMEETYTGVDVKIPARRARRSDRVYFPDLYDLFEDPSRYLVREGEKFVLRGGDVPVTFGLFQRTYRERYAIYLRLCEGERRGEEELREPFDQVEPGYGQYEADEWHELEERDSVSRTAGETSRFAKAGGYFSYDLAVDPDKKNVLSFSLFAEDGGKPLTVTAGGKTLFSGRPVPPSGQERYRMELELPKDLIQSCGRKKVVRGEERTVLRVVFAGEEREAGARVGEAVCIFTE